MILGVMVNVAETNLLTQSVRRKPEEHTSEAFIFDPEKQIVGIQMNFFFNFGD